MQQSTGASSLLLIALLAQAGASAAVADSRATLSVGSLTLQRCTTAAPWCSVLERALDPTGAVPGKVPVYFEYYPHEGPGTAVGMLVATEGGPGYPATGSRGEYLALFAPLRARYDVLIMDNRGTGRSGAIDCRELEAAERLTESRIGGCGRALGRTAPLYSTALAADDLAAILDALGVARVGLYGDSYGTYFAQVFILRHREKVRALVLDGAYPLDGADYGWYPHYAPAMRAKFNLACARDPACGALPGSSLEHIMLALERLRQQPVRGTVRLGGARPLEVTADAPALATVMFGGSPAFSTVREVDAAARALMDGDSLPLLRLVAETESSVDSRDPAHDVRRFSAGLAAAVVCHDEPQIFDMQLAVPERIAARDRLIEAREATAPGTYAPFTIAEYRRMPLDYAFIDQCVEWPPPPAFPASPLIFALASYPDVPVLVVSGELDNMTSVADGQAAAERFSHAHHVVIANSFHVNALPHARSACGATLVRRFLDTLSTGDESCAAAVPAIRLVPRFARTAHELTAATASAGNEAGEEELRVVQAALLTLGDVLARVLEDGEGEGAGLRGGSFKDRPGLTSHTISLQEVRWTEDVAVSGLIVRAGRRSGLVQARLQVRSGTAGGALDVRWREGVSGARASVRGTLNGRRVAAEAPAP